MTISVIIPCYNAEKYLGECLDSVLAQEYRDLEVILVDDGSRDHTLEIAKAYAQRDTRMRVFHQENRGVCAARNLGLSKAYGEWIAFVDADDLLPLDAFEVMASAIADNVDMVVCAHETFDETGRHEVVWPQTRWMDLPPEKRRHAAALRLIEGDSVLNIMCNKLHRRSLIEREQLRLVEGIRMAEDALFNLEAVLCGREIAYVNRITYQYRTHSLSATQSRVDGEFEAHKPWLDAVRAMLERRGVMERFYCAYVDSVVLRLYKDGGIGGVLREFKAKAQPMLGCGSMKREKLSLAAKLTLSLCESGLYTYTYPFLAIVQIVMRKTAEAAFAFRKEKEKPEW